MLETGSIWPAGIFLASGLSSAVIPLEVHTPKCRRFPDGSRCAEGCADGWAQWAAGGVQGELGGVPADRSSSVG